MIIKAQSLALLSQTHSFYDAIEQLQCSVSNEKAKTAYFRNQKKKKKDVRRLGIMTPKRKCIDARAPIGFLTGISKNKQQMAATQEEMYLR